MKLFVDDIRKCPDGWTPARTITEAIRILSTQEVSEVSLDYDIQCENFTIGVYNYHSSKETFEPVAIFLNYYDVNMVLRCAKKIRIHTSNFEGGKIMASRLGIEYKPYVYNEDDYK